MAGALFLIIFSVIMGRAVPYIKINMFQEECRQCKAAC